MKELEIVNENLEVAIELLKKRKEKTPGLGAILHLVKEAQETLNAYRFSERR